MKLRLFFATLGLLLFAGYGLFVTHAQIGPGQSNFTNQGGGTSGGGFVISNKCSKAGTTSVACGSSTGGSFSCSTSGGTCTVATTAVTSTSVILVTLVGVPPPGSGVTCATTITPTAYLLTGITPGTGFTISNATFAANVACYQYAIF